MSDAIDSLPEERRREIFAAVVAAQDGGASVVDSRRSVASRFALPPKKVAEIEAEGVENDWPPL
jgi:hypothetical protein